MCSMTHFCRRGIGIVVAVFQLSAQPGLESEGWLGSGFFCCRAATDETAAQQARPLGLPSAARRVEGRAAAAGSPGARAPNRVVR
jgi:hypothetical protein